jgi:CheY-like chemotaxis protein
MFSMFLTRAGAEVSVAANGAIALDMLEEAERTKRPYGLLLTDIQMPEMDGYSLMRIVHASNRSLPMVAISAMLSAEARQNCLDSGCSAIAGKPIDGPELVAICSRFLAA